MIGWDRIGAAGMTLLSDEVLEQSTVVANCRMNRLRRLVGANGYTRELGFCPLEFLWERAQAGRPVAWLDLCCGSGQALIEAARVVHAGGLDSRIAILGIDLVGHFSTHEPGLSCLRLVEGSVSTWNPDRPFDLITCVHGLHYVGDKLGLVSRAAAWLVEDGRCVAHLDVGNLRSSKGAGSGRAILAALRGQGLEYDRRRRLLKCQGRKALELPFRYLGADDQVGPNYTGQPAVASHYEAAPRSGV